MTIAPRNTSNFFMFHMYFKEPGSKHLATLKESTQAWLVEHKIKGFYTVTESGEAVGPIVRATFLMNLLVSLSKYLSSF